MRRIDNDPPDLFFLKGRRVLGESTKAGPAMATGVFAGFHGIDLQ